MNWHTKSQGPKKKCTHFTRERIHSCPVDTARNKGSFTSIALWSVQSFLSNSVDYAVHIKIASQFLIDNFIVCGLKRNVIVFSDEGNIYHSKFYLT